MTLLCLSYRFTTICPIDYFFHSVSFSTPGPSCIAAAAPRPSSPPYQPFSTPGPSCIAAAAPRPFSPTALLSPSAPPTSRRRSRHDTLRTFRQPTINSAEPCGTVENSNRALAQRRRRDRERALRSPHAIDLDHLPSNRQLAQRRRREKERAVRSQQLHDELQPSFPSCRSHSSTRLTRRRCQRRQQATAPYDAVLPHARRRYVEVIDGVSFGVMNAMCTHCHALHWLNERLKRSSLSSPQFSLCCHNGKVRLEMLPDPPEQLLALFTADTADAKRFRENIRQYNCALAFTSFTANEQDVNSRGGGPWVWKTGYTIYHRAGSLFPNLPRPPIYSQLYFYDPTDAVDYRMQRNDNLQRDTMLSLQNMLLRVNRYSSMFFHAFEILQTTPSRDLGIRILADPSTDLRRYNLPSVDEIAVIVPGQQDHAMNPRDIVLQQRGGDHEFIHDHHYAYAPLHYVLLFPYGSPGWTYGMPLQQGENDDDDDDAIPLNANAKHITQVQFYSYRLHSRDNEFPIVQHGGRLFQQYVCDVWVSTDQNRLRWVENHQPQLRAMLYSGLEDAVGHGEQDVNLHDVGHRVVLPSSYTGGPRYMNQRFQDAIALARHYQGFDLFITFTTNPLWPEISSALLPGQIPADRPDLTSRVFNMYKSSLIDDLTKNNVFGDTLGYVFTIEFQKRGLPHMHMLLSLSPLFRPTSSEHVDSMIRATWPDPIHEPRLFEIVKHSMVHGPCGPAKPAASCMKEGKCSKGFPKPFQAQTVMTRDGYPIYARPNDGHVYEVRHFMADNRWIVPYNPYLLSR